MSAAIAAAPSAVQDGRVLLGFSLFALGLGPLLVWIARRHAWSTVALDAFCLLTISGFALLHLLPESAAHGGWLVLPLALLGFLLPTLAERTLHHGHAGMRRTVLVLAVLGIAAHACLDGFFLTEGAHPDHSHGHAHTHEVTAWAIILHRIPEGIGIWWIVPRTLGFLPAGLITLGSVSATLFGVYLGDTALADTSRRGPALLQSLLVGSLLHVVLHSHIPAPRETGRFRIASVGGAAAAAMVLWIVIRDHFPAHEHGSPAEVFVRLALDSAPALLIAYLLVGLCHAFLPANWLSSLTRGSKLSQALRGVAVGLPVPVCSCGVVPIYRELIRQGAAMAAAMAFLVATPELEVAAVMLTWQLMGGEVALVRVAMAAALALAVGVFVASLTRPRTAAANAPVGALPEPPSGSLGARLMGAVRFGRGPAADHTAAVLLAGILLSALLMPYVDREWIASLPAGIDVPIAAALGLPLYVCATGSTPLAAMLLVQGLSPGAVLAFLLTGPATNVTTFGVLARLHGARTAALFAVSMWVGAVGLGYLANRIVPDPVVPSFVGEGHHAASAFGWLLLYALAAVFLLSLLRQGVRPFLERLFESPANLDHGCCDDGNDHHHHHHHDHHHDHHGPGGHDHAPAGEVERPAAAPAAPGGGCCGHRS